MSTSLVIDDIWADFIATKRPLLSLYYQEELTMKEISRVMGVSESRVCQLHMPAILRLRGALQIEQKDTTVHRKKERRAAASGGKLQQGATGKF